jgi:hypothetical protein
VDNVPLILYVLLDCLFIKLITISNVNQIIKGHKYLKTLLITENFPPKSGGSGRRFWAFYSRLPQGEYEVLAG